MAKKFFMGIPVDEVVVSEEHLEVHNTQMETSTVDALIEASKTEVIVQVDPVLPQISTPVSEEPPPEANPVEVVPNVATSVTSEKTTTEDITVQEPAAEVSVADAIVKAPPVIVKTTKKKKKKT